MILDCGGGTVDAGTFMIANENPLRLESQVLNTQGKFRKSFPNLASNFQSAIRKFLPQD